MTMYDLPEENYNTYSDDEYECYEEFDQSQIDVDALDVTDYQAVEVLREYANYLVYGPLCEKNDGILEIGERKSVVINADILLQILVNRANNLFGTDYEITPMEISSEKLERIARDTFDDSYGDDDENDYHNYEDSVKQTYYIRKAEQQTRIDQINEFVDDRVMAAFEDKYADILVEIDTALEIKLNKSRINKSKK